MAKDATDAELQTLPKTITINVEGLRVPAQAGDGESQFQLADCLARGNGVEADMVEAIP